ncbi:hypothetical protein D9E07_25655 [Escherichia coli]|nr:hypothetical protein [Escherichia coli]
MVLCSNVMLLLPIHLKRRFMNHYLLTKPVKNDLIFRLEKKMICLFHIQLRVIQHRCLITHQSLREMIRGLIL